MEIYVLIYANLVRNNVRAINDVPAEYREKVRKLLENQKG